MWSIYVVVQTIGLDPCPNATFIPMAPKIQFLFVVVAIFDYMIRPVASMVYILMVSRVREPYDNRQDLIVAFRCPWPCDVQSVNVARVDGFDDLSSSLGMLCLDRFDDLCHGIECCVPFRAEKEVEYLPIGVEKGGAVFIDEIAVCGDAVRSFLFGEGLWLAGGEAVDGK